MNTAPLPKEIADRIFDLSLKEYPIIMESFRNSKGEHDVNYSDRITLTTHLIDEATRAQPLVEALEAWQNFDSRIHNSGDVALLHMKAHKALTEYNQQP